ncbi:MAG: hypothetical protein ACI91F_001898, partial [Candidatus Binatia bacterium]
MSLTGFRALQFCVYCAIAFFPEFFNLKCSIDEHGLRSALYDRVYTRLWPGKKMATKT